MTGNGISEQLKCSGKWKCDICGSYLTTKHSLQRHMKRHLDVKQYFECDICHKLFEWESSMIRHRGSIHGILMSKKKISL
ncbi:hypothetical protein TNIN_132701 [Trichonephila inaurata madagascariensis]|uniref:C2H2-type domain-containing protein n=1 Tax=Trichonephila inaurata madagascariensis TaxID=2747483 RepID=A0A8X7CN25_9ARAC|nr:hypothetical protein TNIN_132701 [Trichonephila inaurata madagascariensis]